MTATATVTPTAEVTATRRRAMPVVWGGLLVVALIISITAAIMIGAADLSPVQVWTSIGRHLTGLTFGDAPALSPLKDGIVWNLRLPRVLTAAAVGAGLALSGTVMQALTRNPLADPYLLGLSSGATIGAVAVLLLNVAVLLPVAAFVGSAVALGLTLALASAMGPLTPTRTVLAGLAVSAGASAITSLVVFWTASSDAYREILGWLMGSLGGARWDSVAIAMIALVIAGLPIMASGRVLDAFVFGDSSAAALGIRVGAARWGLLTATALLTGAMVSVSGSIGFVGLILPHAVRLLVGSGHRALLPLSALAGSIFLIWADTLARSLFDPRELPVGIVTAMIGAPAFALVLLRSRGRA